MQLLVSSTAQLVPALPGGAQRVGGAMLPTTGYTGAGYVGARAATMPFVPQRQAPAHSKKNARAPGDYSRKDKSLGLLAERFIDYCNARSSGADKGLVSLDAAATALDVGRRRIYDVTNILEALDMVSRRDRNLYAWHGTVRIGATIKKLYVSAYTVLP